LIPEKIIGLECAIAVESIDETIEKVISNCKLPICKATIKVENFFIVLIVTG